MTPIDILKAARDLIADPSRWAQGYFARTETGESCASYCEKASCWCLWGAILKVCGFSAHTQTTPEVEAALGLLDRAARCLYPDSWRINMPRYFAVVNDDQDHAGVLALTDLAIELAEAA